MGNSMVIPKDDGSMEYIEKYFEQCKKFWMKEYKISEDAATIRALWWDCAEVWNADKSWNDNKIAFINRYRKYTPYDPIPDEESVENGTA